MNPIRVWRFEDAPEEFRRLSRCGGDEDWVAHVPAYLVESWIPWLEGSGFGVCAVEAHRLADGSEVHIGAHA